ncbi:acyl-coenzyme A thioesterase 1-like [Eucyclogobius newberryi]|uniref:acyl-coenzyme A thioesterase 1-like n=1 Tax=Eucyclogobius newberryi TaxID=166745 RepID=UPI003B593AB4
MTTWLRVHSRVTKLHRSLGALVRLRRSSSLRPGPLLTSDPCRALMDEKMVIKGRFLPPRAPVTLCTQLYSEEGDLWQAHAHYNTDPQGSVDLCRDASLGGSFVGCEPMGLFWALQPAPGGREGLRLRKKNMQTPYVFNVSVMGGHVSPGDGGSELASVSTERWYMAPGVKRHEVRQNGLVGTLFLPPGPGPFPAMLDIWGMGGGLVEYRSALLASRGYASFSLAYFAHTDLPGPLNTINVGKTYFKAAFQFLQDHAQVCEDRVGIIGLSYGVYLGLRTSTLSGVQPSCLICINGPVGSTTALCDEEGRTEPFQFSSKFWRFNSEGYVIFRDVSHPQNLPPSNLVKMEDIPCPVMFIVGEDDISASSVESADLLEQTLEACGKGHLFTRLSYPGAGHLIEPPFSPHNRMSLWSVKPKKLFVLWGGHLVPHAAAQEDAWTKMQQFMDTHLRGDRGH